MDQPETTAGLPAHARGESLAGKDIDGFLIQSLLGTGGMGEVWKARDVRLDRPVALKIVAELYARDREFRARFEREARAASALNHPNVAQVYAFGEYSGRPYYVMEYVEGRSLAEVLKEQGRMSGLKCLDYLAQACEGLKAALEQGIVHRDMKPANLMLDPKGRLKIVDFGLAKRLADSSTITRTDAVIGTPYYMSPEQAMAGELDHRSDIYSLGATFYHMFAGEPPFEAPTPIAIVMKHVQEPLRPLKQCNPRVPQPVCSIIERMMSKGPNDRYQDYDELLADLGRAQAGKRVVDDSWNLGPHIMAAEPTPPEAGQSRRTWILVALIGVVSTVLVFLLMERAGIVEFAKRKPPGEEQPPSQTPLAARRDGSLTGPDAASRAEPGGSTTQEGGGAPGVPWPFDQSPDTRVIYQNAMHAKTMATMKRLTTLIAVYTSERGEPLSSLTDLSAVGETYPEDLQDAWGRALLYKRLGGFGYRLVSPGPDGQVGTKDDVIIESQTGERIRVVPAGR